MPSAAFFDLDKTVIAESSTLAFGRPFRRGGLISRREAAKAAYAQLAFVRRGADGRTMERLRDHVARTCAGWEVARVRDIVAATLVEVVEPLIFPEAATLIAAHRAAGREVILVSSSGIDVVGPVGAHLGADRVVATEMVVDAGVYTGEISFYAYGANKARAVTELAAESGYDLADCYGYSDSITDLPMLSVVGHPVAVNPDRALRQEAVRRGWPVRDFQRPAGRRVPAALALTGLAVAAAAPAAWIARSRRSA